MHTRDIAGEDWRMLILDDNYSHVTIEFMDYCETNQIALYCLPPHSTHIVQPLEVGLFSPLQHHYSKQLMIMYGMVYMASTKAIFFLYTYKHDMQPTFLQLLRKPNKPVGYFLLIPESFSTNLN